MRKLFPILAVFAFFLWGCSNSSETTEPTKPKVVLVPNVDQISALLNESVTFKVTADGEDVTSSAVITNITSGQPISGATFTSDVEGVYEFTAVYKSVYSDVVRITVVGQSISEDKPVLTANHEEIYADQSTTVNFTVTTGTSFVTSSSTITNITTGEVLAAPSFRTGTPGTYEFQASYGGSLSNIWTVVALPMAPEKNKDNTVLLFISYDSETYPALEFENKVNILKKNFKKTYNGNLLVYCDKGDSEPLMVHIYENMLGEGISEVIKEYKNSYNSSPSQMMKTALNDARDLFPASNYGMIVRTAGRGWDPLPQEGTGVSVVEMAEAIPFKLNYIIFDSENANSIEGVYEMRDKVDTVISPWARDPKSNFNYSNLMQVLIGGTSPDFNSLCVDFYEFNEAAGVFDARISGISTSPFTDQLPLMIHDLLVTCDEPYIHWPSNLSGPFSDIGFAIINIDWNRVPNRDEFISDWPNWYSTMSSMVTSVEGTSEGLFFVRPAYVNRIYENDFMKLKYAQAAGYDFSLM